METEVTNGYGDDYAWVLAEARALPRKDIARPASPVDSFVRGVVAKLPALDGLRPRVARLPEYDMREFDELGRRARALAYAESLARGRPLRPVDFARKAAALASVRRRLLAECAVLAHGGALPAELVRALRRSRSRLTRANAVRTLASYLLEQFTHLAERTRLTRPDLEEMVALADAVHDALIALAPTKRQRFDTTDMQLRIYSLLARSLREVRAALRYLFRADKAGFRAHMPNCYPHRTTRGRTRKRRATSPAARPRAA